MTTEEKFRAAVNVIKNLPKNGSYQPSHELMLRFYAYFKQATEGPCKLPRPAFWEVVKKVKWEAWNRLGNMAREEAMANYVEELKKIVETMAYTDNVASFLGSLGSFYDHVPVEDLELLVGPVIERIRSQPGSPLSGSPFGSREASPTRAGGGGGAGARMVSSLDTSPASSYSASPLPPEDEDDDEEFKDTLESAPVLFAHQPLSTAPPAPPAPSAPSAPPAPPSKKTAVAVAVGQPGTPRARGFVSNRCAAALNGYAHHADLEPARGRGDARRSASPPPPPSPPPSPVATSTPRKPRGAQLAALDAVGAAEGAVEAAVSAAVTAAVGRLQQDLQQVMARLGSLERAVLARDAAGLNQGAESGARAAARVAGPRWWPLRDLSPRTLLLLALWPLVVHALLAWLQRRRRPRLA